MRLKLINILHSGYSGERGTQKIGKKYEYRKNRIFNIDIDDLAKSVPIYTVSEDDYHLLTTPFRSLNICDDGTVVIETNNSIYEFEEVTDNE